MGFCMCLSVHYLYRGGGIERVDLWVVWGIGIVLGLFLLWFLRDLEDGWFVVCCGCVVWFRAVFVLDMRTLIL